VRTWLSAAAPLSEAVVTRLRNLGVPVMNYYGTAETGPLTLPSPYDPPGSLGSALPGVELRTTASGEIEARSMSMASSYIGKHEEWVSRLRGDFYMTADRGHLVEGKLYLTGRTSDFINVGGRKVDPHRVEEAIRRFVGADLAILGLDDDLRGEIPVLLLTGPKIDLTEIREKAGRDLATYELPVRIYHLSQLPRTSSGKLARSEAARMIQTQPQMEIP
jgi:acyl-coenzyme A synthetase/AMP-(fatty) acid ligase